MGRFSQSFTARRPGRWRGLGSPSSHPYLYSTWQFQDGKPLRKLQSATLPNKNPWLRPTFCLTDMSVRQEEKNPTGQKNPTGDQKSATTETKGNLNQVVIKNPQGLERTKRKTRSLHRSLTGTGNLNPVAAVKNPQSLERTGLTKKKTRSLTGTGNLNPVVAVKNPQSLEGKTR